MRLPTYDKTPAELSAPVRGWSLFEGTLARELLISGTGLHTGRKVSVRIFPRTGEGEDRGILFRRLGSPTSSVSLDPHRKYWVLYPLCSTLRASDGTLFRTVEHLLASLLFCEIDHATVELDGEEVPILDGSAQEWVQTLQACGRISLARPKRFLRIKEQHACKYGTVCSYTVKPAETYRITLANHDRGFGISSWEGDMTPQAFAQKIAPARSYGRITYGVAAMAAGYLLGKPLLRGANFSSVAAIFNNRVIGGTRFADEFVRHRVLDLCGDFAIAGAPVLGEFRIMQPSHRRNLRFMRHIVRQCPDIWEWAVFRNK